MSLNIRSTTRDDVELILEFIQALARYEKLEHEVVASPQRLSESLFGERPYAEAIIAEWQNRPAGFALFFHNYSTFLGRPGIYLEDLFVNPQYRGLGIGKAVLKHLAQLSLERGGGRLDWAVLDWNETAIGFYQKLGAVAQDEWTGYRLSGTALEAFASS